MLEFCTRIKDEITYDSNVKYSPSDVVSTMASRRGHCGHIYNVFAQLCRRVGIPVRIARGLSLNTPDGHGKLFNVRADWTNVHSWAEVYFPEVGWIEVEPSRGAESFLFHLAWCKTTTGSRTTSCRLWLIMADGKLQGAGWTPENGAFVSPTKLERVRDSKSEIGFIKPVRQEAQSIQVEIRR